MRKSAVRRAYRRNPKAVIIAAVALVLVVAIAVVIFRFAFPEQWNRLLHGDPLYSASSQWKPGDLKVHFIDIGQGDFIYIQFPDGEDMVIDCGSTRASANTSESMQSRAVDYLAPFSDDDVINHLMLTHTDMDHVSYLDEIVYRYQIEHIYMPNILAARTAKAARRKNFAGKFRNLTKQNSPCSRTRTSSPQTRTRTSSSRRSASKIARSSSIWTKTPRPTTSSSPATATT